MPAPDAVNASEGTPTGPEREFFEKSSRVRVSGKSQRPYMEIDGATHEDQIKLESDYSKLKAATLDLPDNSEQYQRNIVMLDALDKTITKLSSENIKNPTELPKSDEMSSGSNSATF
jgi:hypothetical protein